VKQATVSSLTKKLTETSHGGPLFYAPCRDSWTDREPAAKSQGWAFRASEEGIFETGDHPGPILPFLERSIIAATRGVMGLAHRVNAERWRPLVMVALPRGIQHAPPRRTSPTLGRAVPRGETAPGSAPLSTSALHHREGPRLSRIRGEGPPLSWASRSAGSAHAPRPTLSSQQQLRTGRQLSLAIRAPPGWGVGVLSSRVILARARGPYLSLATFRASSPPKRRIAIHLRRWPRHSRNRDWQMARPAPRSCQPGRALKRARPDRPWMARHGRALFQAKQTHEGAG